MKLAKLYYKYIYPFKKRYNDFGWTGGGNLGDNVQTLAVLNVYKSIRAELLPHEMVLINRDEMKSYHGEDVVLLMQGWFGKPWGDFEWPPSPQIHPVFTGFHLANNEKTRQQFQSQGGIEYLKQFEPIGCRDLNTRDYLLQHGVNAYFSGCNTLTFPKRETEPIDGKVYIVDVDPKWHTKIPQSLRSAAIYVSQGFYFNQYPPTDDEAIAVEHEANSLIEEYRDKARLVVTSRIHCAMPCLAMGIPVIFLCNGYNRDARFSVLQHFIPTYTIDDIDNINWEPHPITFEPLKQAMIKNAAIRIEALLTGKKLTPEKSQELIDNLQAEFATRKTFFPQPRKKRTKKEPFTKKHGVPATIENKALIDFLHKSQIAALKRYWLRCRLLRGIFAFNKKKREHYRDKAKEIKAFLKALSQNNLH